MGNLSAHAVNSTGPGPLCTFQISRLIAAKIRMVWIRANSWYNVRQRIAGKA
jgi:hypothetical protein